MKKTQAEKKETQVRVGTVAVRRVRARQRVHCEFLRLWNAAARRAAPRWQESFTSHPLFIREISIRTALQKDAAKRQMARKLKKK
jgi:hypothetical protein